MAHPNEEMLREAYDAFAKGDMDAVRERYWTEDITFHVGGRNSLSGTYRGADEVLRFFGELAARTEGTFQVAELHAVLADDEHAVALARLSGRRGDKSLDVDAAHVFHLRDGRVAEFWDHPADQYAWDEFWEA